MSILDALVYAVARVLAPADERHRFHAHRREMAPSMDRKQALHAE
jgi:hypothetical protein